MGTANFCVDNASEYFVVGDDFEDEFEWDSLNEDLTDIICEQMPKGDEWGHWGCDKRTIENGGLRSYPRSFLASTNEILVSYGGIDVCFTMYAYMTSGYYEGATLDWTTDLHNDYENIDDMVESTIEGAIWDCQVNAGMAVIHKDGFKKKLEQAIKIRVDALESIYKKVSQHRLHCIGRFSNGEAVYKNVKSEEVEA